MQGKKRPITNLQELRFKMAEKFAALENGEISAGDAKAFVGLGTVIVNSLKVELINNQISGITNCIDFISGEQTKKIEDGHGE